MAKTLKTAINAVLKNEKPLTVSSLNEAAALNSEATDRYRNLLNHADIPPRYCMFTMESVKAGLTGVKADVYDRVRAYVNAHGTIMQRDQARHSIFLSGSFGSGKTTLGVAALKALCWARVETGRGDAAPTFEKFYTFTRCVQAGYSDGTASATLQGIQRAPLLMLDDVGDLERSRTETDDKRALLYEVLDYRSDHFLPTILTTNLSADGLSEAFGARTFERILEMSALIELGGENLRLL